MHKRILLFLTVLPQWAFAQSFDIEGDCGGSSWTATGVDLGSAFQISADTTQSRYVITPVPVVLNGTSLTLRNVIVYDNGTSGVTTSPFDGIYILTSDNLSGLVLESSSASFYTSTAVPSTLSLGDFDQRASVYQGLGLCGSVTSIVPSPSSLNDVVDAMRTLADASYTTLNGATATLEDSGTLVTAFGDALDDLTAAGCNVDPDTTAVHIGAAYGSAGLLGSDENGDLTGEVLHRPTRTFGATLSDGSTSFGTPEFSVYGGNRLYADQSDGGFVFGLYKRTRGARGTAYALSASCPAPLDPAAVLDGWLDGM
ncbi:MAG: hypothetical protein H6736_01505 [Alphaproteobacteria bacterium]|nr:hypothetical protein [Alphaproteobacteria bacterium]MCB9690467.1 hypothetical protein [Alphaproteobacteria bacterium]